LQYLCKDRIVEQIIRYYGDLLKSGIIVAPVRDIFIGSDEKLNMVQELIKGDTLKKRIYDLLREYAKSDLDMKWELLLFEFVEKIIEIQNKVYLYNHDIRLDLNTSNFIVNNNDLVLIDVVPPLYASSFSNSLIYPLNILLKSFETNIDQWISFFGYLMRQYVEIFNGYRNFDLQIILMKCLDTFVNIINKHWGNDASISFSAYFNQIKNEGDNIFENRIALFNQYVDGEICQTLLHKKCMHYSVSRLLKSHS